MIMSGKHYKYAENWNGKNTDGTTGITYYNGCSAADIEDITGFPGGNSNYQNLWVCHIFLGIVLLVGALGEIFQKTKRNHQNF